MTRSSSRGRAAAVLLLCACLGVPASLVRAQTPSPTLEQQVQELSKKVETLEKQSLKPAGGAQETPKQGQVVAGLEGLGLKSADNNFSVQLHALVQTDARFFAGGTFAGIENDQFLVRRARPILTGTVYGFTSFKVTPEFASNGKTLLYDAFVDVAPWSFARLRAGKFKPPIGLEHLQEDAYTTFAERGFPNMLLPQRDTGFQLSGDIPGGWASYAMAATNGVGDNTYTTSNASPITTDTDGNNGKEVSGRLVFKPFKNAGLEPLKGLNVGCGATFADNVATNPSYSSPGQNSIFTANTNATPDGKHTRFAPELDYYYGPLRVYAEWIRSSQVWGVTSTNVWSHRTITNQAGQAGVAYVLTGEKASFSGVKPAKPFDPKAGTWGAFEAAARYEGLYMDSANYDSGVTTSAKSVRRAAGAAVGLNWYWNNFVMMKSDFEYTTFKQGAAVGDRLDERFFVTRLQLAF